MGWANITCKSLVSRLLNLPDIEVFLDFLEERMDMTAPSTPSSKQHSHQHKRPQAMVHSTSVDKTCVRLSLIPYTFVQHLKVYHLINE